MMWFFLLLLSAHTELVFLQGKHRLILEGKDNPCEGHVKIYHKNQWGYVGDKNWNRTTEEVVCRSTHCGKPEDNATENVLRPIKSKVWLNEVRCSGHEKHLEDCEYLGPGWGISVYRKETVKKIKCSNKIKISLEGSRCAGVVQYAIDEKTPPGYFCADSWGKDEYNFLCGKLGCGKSKEINVHQWMTWKELGNQMMKIDCTNITLDKNMTNILWWCVTGKGKCQDPASVICTAHERLQLKGDASNVCSGQLETEENGTWKSAENITTPASEWCQRMNCGTKNSHVGTNLTCTDNVTVVLKDNNKSTKCYGEVHINKNGKDYAVCGSTWSKKEAEVVCKELGCGRVIDHNPQSTSLQGIMDNVNCLGNESSLWHCQARHLGKDTHRCSSIAYVVCSGSLNARLVDGPGKCAGRVEIQYKGRWRQVRKDSEWTDDNSNSVCKEMECGKMRKSTGPGKFSQGSGDFLSNPVKCNKDANNISACDIEIERSTAVGNNEAVGVICEDHKVIFLEGNNSCSGKVVIEHGDTSYWLSGSNNTWNSVSGKIVCQQIHCGNFVNFSTVPAEKERRIWSESYYCSDPTTRSLFECKNESSNASDRIATVTCSGNKTVSLTETCWGNVKVCFGGKCGGVCADSWTKDLSELLCKSLDCGNTVLSATKMHDKTMQWIFKSLHPTKQTTNLNQSSIVLNDTNICTQKAAYVVCSGNVKPKFDTPRDKCVGNVVVSFEDQWLPVCTNALQNKQEQDAMCEALECGQAVKMTGYFGPKPGNKPFISELQCSSTEKMSLKSCNKITAKTSTCTPAVLQCNKWKKMTVSETCSGIVVVHSNENRGQVSFDGWTNTDGDRLCKDLECGSVKSNQNYSTSEKHSVWGKTFNCTYQNNTENIWDCEMQISSSQQLLSIDCRDKPRVTLSEKCGGAVMINEIQVCDTHWKKEYSDMICQEQNCSNALHFSTTGPQPDPATDYYHVSCDDYHHELGQCKRVKGKCAGKLVSVNCVGNVQFNTTEKCGGFIKVSYIKNTWEHVCTKELSDTFKEQLCKKLDCVGLNTTYRPSKREQLVSSIGLECTDDHMDIRHCLNSNLSCEGVKPAEVFCKGYKAHTPPKKESKPVPVVPIILGVGLFLVLVILIVIFVRIYTVKKAKNAMNDPSRMLSRKEVEFESGDYEDVTSKENEMEDLSRGRFRSEAEVMMETDARSTSSFPYDDIDEAAEAQPLTSQAATAGASRDIHEDALNKNGVTYEVDDPQENYDDIEASSEITQTKAEVHNSPVTTPESESAVVPPGLVPGDVDYLVPGQDG